MKLNTFNYSLLAVGVAAVMGVSTANAASPGDSTTDNAFAVTNQATATYQVAGNDVEQEAKSNVVTVTVSELGAFTLMPTSPDGNLDDDFNTDLPINPQADETVSFAHTLTNDGNVADTYTITLNGAVAGDDFNYNVSGDIIKYTTDSGASGEIASGGTITLQPGEIADITITATALTKRVIGDNGILTVTATSGYLPSSANSAINTDNAITTTPVYAINKSAITNLGGKNFDINNAESFIKYTIKVKNEGTADGTNLTISDTLPVGLIVDITKAPTVVATDGSPAKTATFINANKGVEITGQGIKQGETITIEFYAKQDDKNLTGVSSIVNDAVVDDKNGMIDSTDDALDENYEDKTKSDYEGTDTNTSEITTTSQTRDITITGGLEKEVALISNNIYKYTITNSGTDITEADAPDEVYFTVTTPTTTADNITIGTVFVDANNDGIADAGEILTADGGNYDLNDAVTAGLATGESVEISVQVNTNGTGDNSGTNNIGESEEMVITVLPQTIVDGTPVPANQDTTFNTTMQGIYLKKYQIVDDCGTAITTISDDSGDWSTDPATATAGQCIFYKLEATNTFTNTDITGVTVTDSLDSQVNYRDDFAATPIATEVSSGSEVKGTFGTLAGKTKGVIKFSVKTSQAGNPVTP